MAKTTRQRPRPKKARKFDGPNRKKASKSSRSNDPFKGQVLGGVLYGPSGVGKTSLASHFPDAGFIIDPQEEGIKHLAKFKRARKPVFIHEAENFKGLLRQCDKIAAGKTGIRTAVFDSLTGFEKLAFHHHCKEHYDNDWSKKGFYNYSQGPKNTAKTDWPLFIDHLNMIRAEGIHVILIAHSQIKQFSNPLGDDYDRYSPYLDKEIWSVTHRWAQLVMFYNYHFDMETRGIKPKAKMESEERHLWTEWTPVADAKNQFGLDQLIEGGTTGKEAYQNFVDAFSETKG